MAAIYKTDLEIEASKGAFTIWHKVVTECHNRVLTHASDLLPALSGIVTRLQMFGAGESLAGLWVRKLHDEMLSYISMSRTGKPWIRPQPYRVPNWSWASLVRPLQQNVYDTVLCCSNHYGADDPIPNFCRILQASCTPAGRDENGAVFSGQVKLWGILIRIDYEYEEDSGTKRYVIPLDKLLSSPWLDYHCGIPTFIRHM